ALSHGPSEALLHCGSVGGYFWSQGRGSSDSRMLQRGVNCSLCLDILKDPVSLSCGHTFCKECIQEVINRNQQKNSIKTAQ
uniref:RING-type domain-containing protein n=1 Tax=Chelydra serpentina TaxID=8475 RepID=A0A8C3XQ96_CHESE